MRDAEGVYDYKEKKSLIQPSVGPYILFSSLGKMQGKGADHRFRKGNMTVPSDRQGLPQEVHIE